MHKEKQGEKRSPRSTASKKGKDEKDAFQDAVIALTHLGDAEITKDKKNVHISAAHDVQVGRLKDTEDEGVSDPCMKLNFDFEDNYNIDDINSDANSLFKSVPVQQRKRKKLAEEGGRKKAGRKKKAGQKKGPPSKRMCKKSKGQVGKEGNKKVVYNDGISRPSYIKFGPPSAKVQPV
eukprot:7155421-Ditylum_brightwellii.AAC.1